MAAIWKRVLAVSALTTAIAIALLGKWDWLVYGLFLLCPLMHLFGHHHSGHSGHSGNNAHSNSSKH